MIVKKIDITQRMLLAAAVVCIVFSWVGAEPAYAQTDENKYKINIFKDKFFRAPAKCDSDDHSAPPRGVENATAARLTRGNDNSAYGVILVHGFIASPAEVIYLAERLRQAGYKVYLPLIPGFGGNTEMANDSSLESWNKTLPDAVAFMTPCFPNLHLMGFSLGGTLVSDFVLREVDKAGSTASGAKIHSVTLLAPYYRNKCVFADFLAKWLSYVVDSIYLGTAYSLNMSQDLRIPMDNTEYYNEDFPLTAVDIVRKYGKELRSRSRATRSNIPIFLGTTASDECVDSDAAEKFLKIHFGDLKSYEIPEIEKLPHQFVARSGQPGADKMIGKIIEFIKDAETE